MYIIMSRIVWFFIIFFDKNLKRGNDVLYLTWRCKMKKLLPIMIISVFLGFAVSCTMSVDTVSVGGNESTSQQQEPPAESDNGVIVDEEEGIVAGLTLDENIDGNSPAVVYGDTQWVPGIDGTAMEFDAEGEYILLPDSEQLDLTDQGTVEVWIYPYTNIAAAGIIHKGVELDYSDEAYSLQYNNPGQVAFIITNNDRKPTYVISNEDALTTGEWHHIVAAWDLTEVYLYIDGALVINRLIYSNGWVSELPSDFAPAQNSDGELMIGSQIPYSYRFDGIIDDVFIYDRVMDETEVMEHYSALAP
jgi:hypothetical protein